MEWFSVLEIIYVFVGLYIFVCMFIYSCDDRNEFKYGEVSDVSCWFIDVWVEGSNIGSDIFLIVVILVIKIF